MPKRRRTVERLDALVERWTERALEALRKVDRYREERRKLLARSARSAAARKAWRTIRVRARRNELEDAVAESVLRVEAGNDRSNWVPAHRSAVGGGGCAPDCAAAPPHEESRCGGCEAPTAPSDLELVSFVHANGECYMTAACPRCRAVEAKRRAAVAAATQEVPT